MPEASLSPKQDFASEQHTDVAPVIALQGQPSQWAQDPKADRFNLLPADCVSEKALPQISVLLGCYACLLMSWRRQNTKLCLAQVSCGGATQGQQMLLT